MLLKLIRHTSHQYFFSDFGNENQIQIKYPFNWAHIFTCIHREKEEKSTINNILWLIVYFHNAKPYKHICSVFTIERNVSAQPSFLFSNTFYIFTFSCWISKMFYSHHTVYISVKNSTVSDIFWFFLFPLNFYIRVLKLFTAI